MNLAVIRQFKEALGLDNTTAIRLVKWLDTVARAGLVQHPTFQFRTFNTRVHRNVIVVTHIEGSRLGCAHCKKPSDVDGVASLPKKDFRIWHPPDEAIPDKLRLSAPSFLVCNDCALKIATRGYWKKAMDAITARDAEDGASPPPAAPQEQT